MRMYCTKTGIRGLIEVNTEPHVDERGFLTRLYDKKIFSDFGVDADLVQQTLQISKKKNTLRGLHVSLPPSTEGKMLTVIKGEVFWVAVDVRKGSTTFGKWVSVILSGEKNNILFAEPGFAHGCLSLTDDAYLLANASNYFSDEHSSGIIWNDGDLNIDWPLEDEPVISKAHLEYGPFKDFVEKYGGV